MEYFPGTTFNPTDSEVLDFAQAARIRGKWLFTDLNGVGLIADPRPADPEYPEQLLWTYYNMFRREKRVIIGERAFYQNLVPEMQALERVQFEAFARLETSDHRALVQWLQKLVPVTWCRWALSDEQIEELAARLPESPHAPLHDAKLSLPLHKQLGPDWHAAVGEWLEATANPKYVDQSC